MKYIWLCLVILFVVEYTAAQQLRAKVDEDGNVFCACPRNLSPRCGTDGKTYNNKCELDCQAQAPLGRSINLRQAKMGRCEDNNDS